MPDQLNPNNSATNSTTPPSRLQTLIGESSFISDTDKGFLIRNLDSMKPLDRLQLEQSLMSGMVPESLQQVARLRQKFIAKEAPKAAPDMLTKFIQSVSPAAPKVLLSQSILLKPHQSGTPTPTPFVPNPIPAPIANLMQFSSLNQLITLSPAHVSFGVSDPIEQIINDFLSKIDKMFAALPDMVTKRSYLMSFMQSILFRIYLSTGETALRHPELQPRSVALNQMFQIDNRKYLNKNQFQYTSKIVNQIRSMAAL